MNELILLLASTLTIVAPEDGITYDVCFPPLREFVDNPVKRTDDPPPDPDDTWTPQNDWTKERITACNACLYKQEAVFKWQADFAPKVINFEYSETPDFAKAKVQPSPVLGIRKSGSMYPFFLKLGTKYYWRFSAVDKGGTNVVSDVRTITTRADPPRVIGVPWFNFRDLGGGVNAKGKKVRQGLLFRGMTPPWCKGGETGRGSGVRVTAEDYKELYVNHLGIKTMFDIRGTLTFRKKEDEEAELARQKMIAEAGIERILFDPVGYYVFDARMQKNICNIFKALTDETKYPIYIYEWCGCDGTGIISFLIDGLLERDDKWCYDNYELSAIHPSFYRMRYTRMGYMFFNFFDPKAINIKQNIPIIGKPKKAPKKKDRPHKPTGRDIRTNVIKYLQSIGVTRADMDKIRKIMLQ